MSERISDNNLSEIIHSAWRGPEPPTAVRVAIELQEARTENARLRARIAELEARAPVVTEAQRIVCEEIQEIMRVYREQYPNIDTPGGLEHMGDVWRKLESWDAAITAALAVAGTGDGLRIIFDGPPGPEGGRFVEVETKDGRSVNAGMWRQRHDGMWELELFAALTAALAVTGTGDGWLPIETAPKDGTRVDVWDEESGRTPDCYFGLPTHTCGEAGQYCDSDWHRMDPCWIDSTFNVPLESPPTHWRPFPAAPSKGVE